MPKYEKFSWFQGTQFSLLSIAEKDRAVWELSRKNRAPWEMHFLVVIALVCVMTSSAACTHTTNYEQRLMSSDA